MVYIMDRSTGLTVARSVVTELVVTSCREELDRIKRLSGKVLGALEELDTDEVRVGDLYFVSKTIETVAKVVKMQLELERDEGSRGRDEVGDILSMVLGEE